MTLPDETPARNPRRFWLYAPFVLALLLAAAWGGVWLHLRGQVERVLDECADHLRAQGYEVAWKSREVSGFPMRLSVTLTEPRIREPSGWALAAPVLEAEARVHAPGHWLFAAPRGFTFTRPKGGPVTVTGQVIRASLRHLEAHPPNFSFEGVKLTFAPEAGALPFALSSAERVELHLRAAPGDKGSSLLRVADAKGRPGTLWGRIAGEATIDIGWDAVFDHAGAFKGESWPDAVRNWTAAGGTATVKQAGITAGPAVLGVQSGRLSVDPDGRLRGDLRANLKRAPQALAAMGAEGVIAPETAAIAGVVAAARQDGEIAGAAITFQAGRTTLGPVAIGPAPRVY
ncbi:MAG: DUF2125 domain-containing protein [Caulobacteraceae bacterium]|nr:DUF2125 domain-containing protein [Caulobacteraceae bacterium]